MNLLMGRRSFRASDRLSAAYRGSWTLHRGTYSLLCVVQEARLNCKAADFVTSVHLGSKPHDIYILCRASLGVASPGLYGGDIEL